MLMIIIQQLLQPVVLLLSQAVGRYEVEKGGWKLSASDFEGGYCQAYRECALPRLD